MNDNASHLDLSRLNELRDLFQSDFADALSSFLANTKDYMQAVADGLHDVDAKNVEMNAHKLKSSLAMFGAMKASALSLDIEVESRAGNLKTSAVLYEQLVKEVAEAKAALLAYQGPK